MALVALLGMAAGLGAFTFVYAEGASYFVDDPNACVNCHVMRDEFDAWHRSSHKAVATCNDCHSPHESPAKWVVKGVNGWNHSLAFTTGRFPDPIRIRPMNARVTQAACLDCHEGLLSQIHIEPASDSVTCTDCHGSVGHER
jgi:cytochrome c nitrite reductase small subunit